MFALQVHVWFISKYMFIESVVPIYGFPLLQSNTIYNLQLTY